MVVLGILVKCQFSLYSNVTRNRIDRLEANSLVSGICLEESVKVNMLRADQDDVRTE